MKKKIFQLEIPTPCHEDWSAMNPTERGRHCEVCAKEVVDLRNYSDQDLQQFFRTKGSQTVCGRVHPSQLRQPAQRLLRGSLSLAVAGLAGIGTLTAQTPDAKAPGTTIHLQDQQPTSETQQLQVLKGRLTDRETGEPLLFANIAFYEGKTILKGITTDIKGYFEVTLPASVFINPNVIVECSYVGYETKVLRLKDLIQTNEKKDSARKEVTILMELSMEPLAVLGEIVVIHCPIEEEIVPLEPLFPEEKTEPLTVASTFEVLPSPFTDLLQIKGIAPQQAIWSITLVAMDGRTVYQQNQLMKAGKFHLDLDLQQVLIPSGSYLLNIQTEDELLFSQVVIRQ